MFSAVHPTTDIAKILRHVRFVPATDLHLSDSADLGWHGGEHRRRASSGFIRLMLNQLPLAALPLPDHEHVIFNRNDFGSSFIHASQNGTANFTAAAYQASTHGRFRPARCGGFGAERKPLMIQWRVSIGSMT